MHASFFIRPFHLLLDLAYNSTTQTEYVIARDAMADAIAHIAVNRRVPKNENSTAK